MEKLNQGPPKNPDRSDGAAVRTPSASGSSSSDANRPSDAPTVFDLPSSGEFTSDAPTMIDIPSDSNPSNAATMIDAPPRSSKIPMLEPVGTILQPGTVLAQRYQIVKILGEGGMGAVYKAQDIELNRPVALKVIRPDLARHPAIIDRFKQELLLAHQVTHKNVIRIYDLGEAEGMKFITMEYIEGEDLRGIIHERKKLTSEEAVDIMAQVCRALEAAHGVGVIHRDLKPQNIMRDKSGRILVMDFGLARTLEGDGMTQTGALVGTMEYMSPEQALAKELDQRSDLFTVGLIFYELLTGQMPFKADSALASLIKRTQERVAPVTDHDPNIPATLTGIVGKCLERDVNLRYQKASDILADLEAWQGKRAAATLQFPTSSRPWGQTIPWHWIGGIVAAIVLSIVAFTYRGILFGPGSAKAPSGPVVSLAILPFHNASGDPELDWLGASVAEMLSTDVGQSQQLRTVSPGRLHQILTDLRVTPSTVLDPQAVLRVADFSNADRVVWGQYARFGSQIRIDATLQDIKNNTSVPLKIDVPSEKEIPAAIDRLAESIRQKLALPANVLQELKASSFQPTSQSVVALKDYNQGVGLQRDGKNLDARKQFEAATKEDGGFALAFARLAQVYSSLGYDSDAEQAAQKAAGLSDRLPESEKYLISAIRSQVTKNYPEAIKAYQNLEKASPDNADVQAALASLFEDSGDLNKARAYYEKLTASNPKDIAATIELGRVAIKSGDPQGSLDPLNRALSLSIQVDNQEQKATSLHVMAVAYRMLSKPEESLRNEEQALAIWRPLNQKRGLAFSLNETARDQALLGKFKDAEGNFKEALQVRQDIGDKRGQGDTLIDLGNFYDDKGDHDQGLTMYKQALQLERDLGNESLQAICLNNIGTAYSEKGQYEDAVTYFQQALQLREKSGVPQDIVEAVHNLGEASVYMGRYDDGITNYMRALDLRRSMNDTRGAAIESYSLGTLFDYEGRFGAAVNSKQEALKTFRDLKDRTFWMAEMLGGYGEALILAGRGDESKSLLDEALSLARDLKNGGMIAQTLGFQGDAAFYRGDVKTAHALYEQALAEANRSKETDKILIAKKNLAKVQVEEKQAANALSALRPLVEQADGLGLKYISVDCSILTAEAMMQRKDATHARQELERALLRADKLGLQPLSARAHFLLAELAHDSGNNTEAQDHYRETARLLDAMKKDQGAEKMLQRSDFKEMYDAASHDLQAAKN